MKSTAFQIKIQELKLQITLLFNAKLVPKSLYESLSLSIKASPRNDMRS